MGFSADDLRFMRAALSLSRGGRGFTEPNPLVGAVVVEDGRIAATGFHAAFGGPHAEALALQGIRRTGTTLYVTLEPCAHYGKQPPCVDLIVEKRVERVVAAMRDPNPLVDGRGIAALEKRGIRVDTGCLADDCARVNRHYLTFMTRGRPHVTVNAGVSLDGKLTDRFRRSQWITDPELRDMSHSLRGGFSAILVGVKTVEDDDPQLTVRDPAWKGKRLTRVVLDTENRLDTTRRVFQERADFPLFIFSAKRTRKQGRKVERHFFVDEGEDGLDLDHVLRVLWKQNIASVLVEGGGAVIDSFLRTGLYDELVLFTANKLLGGRESVQIFPSGASVDDPLRLDGYEIMEFPAGFVLHWCRSPICSGGD